MTRLGFLILNVLNTNEAFNGASAMSAYEISDVLNFVYKPDSIYKHLSKFEKSGLVKAGFKDGKANTYFITEKGKDSLADARKAG